MATRTETRFSPEVGSLYSYLVTDNWRDGSAHCYLDAAGGITSAYGWGFTGHSVLRKSTGGGVWTDVTAENSASYNGYGDLEYNHVTVSFDRTSSDYTGYVGCYSYGTVNSTSTSGFAQQAFTIPHLPNAPTSLTASYVNDNRINLSWTSPTRSCDNLRLEVKIDGGSWSELPAISASATSYAYTAASADHSYKFRMRAFYKNAYSSYTSETASIPTSPTTPTSISLERADATDIIVTLDNPSTVATSLEWQASYDGGETWSASTTVGGKVNVFQASTSGGTVMIQVRNVNSVGSSAWLVSEPIVTLTPPNPPTLISPKNVLDLSAGSVTFTWQHNAVDGSAQTAATLQYSTDGGGNWTTVSTITTAQSYTISPIPWTAGTTVKWQVKTKGADASYGNFASPVDFRVLSAPTLTITSPAATITTMPISVAATYSDMAGETCEGATYYLALNGQQVYPPSGTLDATVSGTSISASIGGDFLPTNGESYTLVMTARSSSTLQTTANATFLVDFTEPVEGELNVTNDPDTGYVSLLATFDNTGADEPAASISVARVNADGSITPLLSEGASGSGVTDMYAPLNTLYQYAVTTHASTKAVKTVYVDNIIESDRWFCYWNGNVAWAKWNPEGTYAIARPEKKRVHYAGRKWPVSYDSKAMEQSFGMAWTVVDMDDWKNDFVKLMDDGGRGVYKGCDGWVFRADFDYSATPDYKSINRIGQVNLTITRIDGERL